MSLLLTQLSQMRSMVCVVPWMTSAFEPGVGAEGVKNPALPLTHNVPSTRTEATALSAAGSTAKAALSRSRNRLAWISP